MFLIHRWLDHHVTIAGLIEGSVINMIPFAVPGLCDGDFVCRLHLFSGVAVSGVIKSGQIHAIQILSSIGHGVQANRELFVERIWNVRKPGGSPQGRLGKLTGDRFVEFA